jgi:hypothetical protein
MMTVFPEELSHLMNNGRAKYAELIPKYVARVEAQVRE